MHPLERLLNLVALLLETSRPLTFEEIRERIPAYDVDDRASAKRKFERDKDDLRSAGIPLDVAPTDAWESQDGYIIRREKYELPEIAFTPEEAAALFVAATAPGDDGRAAQAFAKLAHQADITVLGAAGADASTSGVDASARALEGVADAVARRRRIRFRYRPVTGKPAKRDVDAWGLVWRGGQWYLVGGDRRRREARSFRLSRFDSDIEDAGEAKPPPEGFRARDHLVAGPWGLGEPEMRAVIALSPKVSWWALSGVPGTRLVTTRDDGWVEAELPARPGDAFVSWVLQFGPDAEVVAPPELRHAVVERLEAVRGSL